jgi:hypothetical protein
VTRRACDVELTAEHEYALFHARQTKWAATLTAKSSSCVCVRICVTSSVFETSLK